MQWETATSLIEYPDALARIESHVEAMRAGKADELIWLLEHPPIYTKGSSAQESDILRAQFPVFETGRGGQVTYHGPGQRVAYCMLDLNKRGRDLRAYVKQLEFWIIETLAQFDVEGFTRDGRIGVWVATPTGEAKIAALGVRVQGWISSHGIAINLNPDLSHYSGIVPCGISEFGVTSLAALGVEATMAELDAALARAFMRVFSIPSAAA